MSLAQPTDSAQSTMVTFTESGSLHLDASVAATYFPADALVAVPRANELWLLPLTGPEVGGLLLKQINPRGDRATVIWEFFPAGVPVGEHRAGWDAAAGALRVSIGRPTIGECSPVVPTGPFVTDKAEPIRRTEPRESP